MSNSSGSAFTVRLATLAEQVEVFTEPRLLAILPSKPGLSELAEYLKEYGNKYRVIILGKHRMLFECYPYGRECGVMEIHLACPKDSIRASRILCLLVIGYVFDKYPETNGLVTSCPEGKIANLCRKLGAVNVGSKGDYVTMFATKEQLGIIN